MNVKKIIFGILAVLLAIVLMEMLSTLALVYYDRLIHRESGIRQRDRSNLSLVNVMRRLGRAFRSRYRGEDFSEYQYDRSSTPHPFFVADDLYGYSVLPGTYTHTYLRRRGSRREWQAFKIKVTINPDGSRWTGSRTDMPRPKIYIFGDSFVFGSGVNDEQTFSYHLQQAMPEADVKLFALGGYSLTQAYLRFDTVKHDIRSQDIILLGYADFYDIRHVVDPVRLIQTSKWREKYDPRLLNSRLKLPRIQLDETGGILVDYIEENCLFNNGYCDESSPGSVEKSNVTAVLINYIADNTSARVYLLHFGGSKDNPVRKLMNDRVTLISALPEDFDYFIRDNIEGFDPHPGPYWHYAISRKLMAILSDSFAID